MRLQKHALEVRDLLAAVFWDGGGDGIQWIDPLNWSGDTSPGLTDDVTINFGSNTIRHESGSDAVHSLSITNNFALTGGSLSVVTTAQVNGTFTLDGGTLSDATVNFTTGQTLVITANGGNRLDGVTVNGDLDLTTDNARTLVVNGLTLNGTALLGNAAGSTYGGMYFDGTQTLGGTQRR